MTDTTVIGNALVAAELAAAGLSVFPCHAGGDQVKRPMPGVYWRSMSTTDRTKIEGWWKRWPESVPAIDLGKSGLLVVDADRHDPDNDGVSAAGSLWHQRGFDPDQCPVVATPNQGVHWYFRQPPGAEFGNGRGALPAGVDVRGAGGYVIAPGAILADGRRYEIFGDLSDAPVMPDWLCDMLTRPRGPEPAPPKPIIHPARTDDARIAAYVEAAVSAEIDAVRSAPRGARNNQLNTSAFSLGTLVGAGVISEAEAASMLEQAAAALAHDDGLPSVQKTIRSGLRSGMREPRQMPEAEAGPTEADYAVAANLTVRGVSPRGRQMIEHADGTLTGEDGVVIEKQAQTVYTAPVSAYPPGLVGAIAQWITATARRPQPEMSIAAAIAVVGAAGGRQIAGPTGAGTALYVLCLAPTSGGKDHPMKQARKLFAAAGLSHHLGPDEFMSMSSVVNTIKAKPLCFAPMDEFGDFMRRIYNKRSGAHERSIPKVLRSCWSTNFGPFTTPVWAQVDSVQIMAAHLTLLGGSTHQQFYSALESGAVSDGTLNRFLIVDVASRVAERDPDEDPHAVPQAIVDGLKAVYFRSGEMATSFRNQVDFDPGANGKLLTLGWGPEARDAYQAFGRMIERRMELEPGNADALSRASEMSIRVATIVAAGRGADAVSVGDMMFGRDLVLRSVEMMIAGAADYMAENETHANSQKVVRLLKQRGGRAPYRDIMRAMRQMRARDLRDLLASMCEAELIEKVEISVNREQGGGHPVVSYLLKQD